MISKQVFNENGHCEPMNVFTMIFFKGYYLIFPIQFNTVNPIDLYPQM